MQRWILIVCVLFSAAAEAQDRARVVVPGSGGRAFQIAVRKFEAGPSQVGLREKFHQELTRALEYSSLMKAVPHKAFLEPIETRDFENSAVRFENWRGIGADALVDGQVLQSGSSVRIRFKVWDVVRQRRQGKPGRLDAEVKDLPKIARELADEIVYRFTGRRGVSSTQIAFVSDRSGNKEIYVMNADGSGKTRVTGNRSINLFPDWSANGRELVYTSYKGGRGADLWKLIQGRKGRRLIDEPFEKFRGVWSPKKGTLAVVMHRNGNTDLFSVRGDGRRIQRLTTSRGIDASPGWSPDGNKIVFVSDRTGSKQLYIKNLGSSEERRITFRGSYNASPAWSPTGEWIAFAAQTGSNFDIYLIDPESGYTTPLVVHPRSDEEPAWSPDGRKLAFRSSRRGRKEVYTINIDGSNLQRLTPDYGNSTNPAWSGWTR